MEAAEYTQAGAIIAGLVSVALAIVKVCQSKGCYCRCTCPCHENSLPCIMNIDKNIVHDEKALSLELNSKVQSPTNSDKLHELRQGLSKGIEVRLTSSEPPSVNKAYRRSRNDLKVDTSRKYSISSPPQVITRLPTRPAHTKQPSSFNNTVTSEESISHNSSSNGASFRIH